MEAGDSPFPLTNFIRDLEVLRLPTDQLRTNAMQKNGPYAGVPAATMRGYLVMNGRIKE